MEKEKKVKKNTTAKTKKKTTKVKKEKFSVGLKKELKAVKWPTIKEILKYTAATVLFCVVLVLFFELLNMLLALVKGMFN